MARSTNSSKKNITTTKKAEAVKTAPVTKESVTEKDKNVTTANEVKKETEKVTSKETEKTAPKKVTKKPVEKKTAAGEPEKSKAEEVKAETKEKKAAVETKREESKSESKPAPKKRGRKPGSKNKQKEQLTPEVYVQYHGEEAEQSAIIDKIKEQYVSEGHRAGNIKSLKLYLKPEDRAAYFVINDRYAGKVDLFNF